VVFIREPDGMLQPTIDLRRRLVREIRRFRPEVVICGDPTIVWAGEDYINHPDHRAAATAALDATFPAAGQPNLFEELEAENLAAHKPRKVYVSGWVQDELFVSIDDTIDLKIASLQLQEPNAGLGSEPMVKQWASDSQGKMLTPKVIGWSLW
jgi:LmbE family N-acetylglucosaminyl deacetylase